MRCAKCNKLLLPGSHVAFDADNNSLCPECFEKTLGSELVKCDVCGKEVDEVYIHNLVNGSRSLSICPECWDELLKPKNYGDVIKLDPNQVDAFNRGLSAGAEMAADKDKKDQIKAIIGIQKELHELNKTLKQIAGRIK